MNRTSARAPSPAGHDGARPANVSDGARPANVSDDARPANVRDGARPANVRDGARPATVRLLALDIDGTLIGDDLRLRPRTIAAVRAATEAGVAVVLATGRMATSALPFARQLGLRTPIIALQGAVVREQPEPGSRSAGRLLVHRPLDAAVARDVLAWCAAHGLQGHVNYLEKMVVPVDDPRAEDYSRFRFGRVVLVPDLVAWVRRPITKVIAVGEAGRPSALLAAAEADFAGRTRPTVSHPMFLEFLAPGVSKAGAMRWLARRLGIDPADTMAIGDQLNDLEMIAEAGIGVAMPTAPTSVLAAALVVAPPVDEEGAAQVIEELVLGRIPGPGIRSAVVRRG